MRSPRPARRYGVFDYFVTSSHGAMHKLVALSWAPDNAPARTKMMYASTKEAFTSCLDGVHAIVSDVQCLGCLALRSFLLALCCESHSSYVFCCFCRTLRAAIA